MTRRDKMPIQMGDIKLYTVEELADILSIKPTTVRKMLREGRIPGRRPSKRWYVSEDSLRAYFQQAEPQKPSD